MTENDKMLLGQMISAGKFSEEIAVLLRKKYADDTKAMIQSMGKKYALHPDNAPIKGNYGY